MLFKKTPTNQTPKLPPPHKEREKVCIFKFSLTLGRRVGRETEKDFPHTSKLQPKLTR